MMDVRVLLLSTVVLAASIRPGEAGPCTAELDRLQARLDAQLGTTASTAPFGQESVGAKLHRQPTPSSVAGAEKRLGDGAGLSKAAAALQRARDLDRAGDRAGCRRAAAAVRRALGG